MRRFLTAVVARLLGYRLLSVGSNDTIVIYSGLPLSDTRAEVLRDRVSHAFGVPAIVIDGGIELGVVRRRD